MDRADELAAIEAFLAERGVTACPPADADSIDLTRLRDSSERRRAAMSRWPHKATGRKRGPRKDDIRSRIAEEPARAPDRGCAAIAAVVGCSPMTVWRIRQTL